MRKLIAVLMVLGVAAGVALAHCGMCDGDAKRVEGVVSVTKGQDGGVTAVKVGDVGVVLDGKGKELAELDGKKVVAEGKMQKHLLAVEAFKIVEAPKNPGA